MAWSLFLPFCRLSMEPSAGDCLWLRRPVRDVDADRLGVDLAVANDGFNSEIAFNHSNTELVSESCGTRRLFDWHGCVVLRLYHDVPCSGYAWRTLLPER